MEECRDPRIHVPGRETFVETFRQFAREADAGDSLWEAKNARASFMECGEFLKEGVPPALAQIHFIATWEFIESMNALLEMEREGQQADPSWSRLLNNAALSLAAAAVRRMTETMQQLRTPAAA